MARLEIVNDSALTNVGGSDLIHNLSKASPASPGIVFPTQLTCVPIFVTAPAHSHDHYEEAIYGIDGMLTWTVDGKQIDVGPGQALCIPRGAVHRFDNNTSHDVKVLCLVTPAAIGPQYFREAAEVIDAAAGGPPDRAKMVEIMLRHGLTPVPPPAQA